MSGRRAQKAVVGSVPRAVAERGVRARDKIGPLLQIGPFVPVLKGYLSRFWNRDKAAGTKALEAFVRVVEPGQNVPRAKKYLRPAGLEPKTYCLVYGFLANSTK